jgi:type IV secretion system protein VirB6
MDNLSYIFGILFGGFNKVIDDVFSGVIGDLILSLSSIARNALILYVIIWGILMIYGRIQDTVADGIKRIAIMLIVLVCATNIPFYSDNIVTYLEGMPGGLTSLLGTSITPSMSTADSAFYDSEITGVGYTVHPIAKSLDAVVTEFSRYMALAQEAASITNFIGVMIQSFFLALAFFVFIGFSAYLSLISLLAVKVLLIVGPIFFVCLLFDGTKNFFSSWLSLVINYSLVGFFAVLFSTVLIKVLQNVLIGIANDEFDFLAIGYVLAVTIVGFLLMLQVQSIASSIAGGLSLNTRIPYLRGPRQHLSRSSKNSETQNTTNPPQNSVENKS